MKPNDPTTRARRGRWARRAALAAGGAIGCIASVGCSRFEAPAAEQDAGMAAKEAQTSSLASFASDAGTPAPLFLLGVDGMDWSVLLPLVRAGRAPVLRGLMERGSFGLLRSQVPTVSPAIWTTIATGKSPRKHGILGFVTASKNEQGEQELSLYTSGERKTKAFWNILSDAGMGVDVIGWWVTYPAEPIRGLMVSQTNTMDGVLGDDPQALIKGSLRSDVEGQVWPRDKEARVMQILAGVQDELPSLLDGLFGTPPNPLGAVEQRLWDETLWAFRADEVYLRLADERLRELPAAVTALYLGEPDVVGHRFWRYAYPEQFDVRPDAAQLENFAGLVDKAYERVDRALGAILARLPADVDVLVVSDHGMHAENRANAFAAGDVRRDLVSGHHHDAPPGVWIAAGPRFAKAPGGALDELSPDALPQVGSVLDVLPTLLVLLGVPVGKDMDGKPLLDRIDPAWLSQHPPRTVPTHDTPQWLAAHAAFRTDHRDQTERLDQLRALGYVK